MALKNFDAIVERAKQVSQPKRVVIAGADAENILLGAFQAQEAGFAFPILVGEREKIEPMLERLGLKDRPHRLVATQLGDNLPQIAVDLVNQGEGDVLMRGNTQTREFLLPLLVPENGLRTDRLLTHIDLVSMPEYPKVIAIGDVTVTIEPNLQQKKMIIQNMVETLQAVGYEQPNIALLSMVEKVAFHMKDTIEAQELVKEHSHRPIAPCQLVGPIAYDLIMSKEAARLKGYECPQCGEFDGIVVPSLLAGNLIVKCWQMHAKAQTCGVVIGAKVPVALTSRSDAKEVAFYSLAFCAAIGHSL
ncbi:MAG: phosphate acyltransferase [Lawsonibacter sp.]